MKNIWVRHFLALVLAVGSGAMLMHTSHDVQRAERELKRLQRSIEREREGVRVLQAEWSYLNRPERLEMLAAQYLDLVPPVPSTLVSSLPRAEEFSSAGQAQDISYRVSPSLLPVPAQKPSRFSSVYVYGRGDE